MRAVIVIGSGWLVATGAVACAPDPPRREIPPVVWAGEHLEYAPQEGAYEPCAGTLPYMDRPWPVGGRVRPWAPVLALNTSALLR